MEEEYALGENVTDLAKGKDGGGVEVSITLSVDTFSRLDYISRQFSLSFSQAVEAALWQYHPVGQGSTRGSPTIIYTLPRKVFAPPI